MDDNSGDTYYYNTVTKETTWDRPASFVESSSSLRSQNQEQVFEDSQMRVDDVSSLSSSEPLRKRTFESVKSNEMWTFLPSSSSATSSHANIIMEDVYDNLPVGDPDGGAWKQGWRVTYVVLETSITSQKKTSTQTNEQLQI